MVNTKTKLKTEEIRELISADKCNIRRGVYTAKWLYYYRFEKDTEHYENKIHAVFPGALIIDSSDNWHSWPKDRLQNGFTIIAWFEVRFTLNN